MRLPRWMRIAMLATAILNIVGAGSFLPSAEAVRISGGLPAQGPPIYLSTTGAFVFIFGLGYLWAAIPGAADTLFIAVAAAAKLTFFGLLVWYWGTDVLPARAPLSGVGDLVFGSLFLFWLYEARLAARLDAGSTTTACQSRLAV